MCSLCPFSNCQALCSSPLCLMAVPSTEDLRVVTLIIRVRWADSLYIPAAGLVTLQFPDLSKLVILWG